MDAAEKRLKELLDVILDSTATDAQRREFAEAMEKHPELVEPLIIQLRTHSLLQWQCDEIKLNISDAPEAVPSCLIETSAVKRSPGRGSLGRLAFIAASLLVAAGALYWWTRGAEPDSVAVVAEVVEEKGVVWSDGTNALDGSKLIRAGKLAIDAGDLTLKFRSGATVRVNGAASMRIESDMLVRLDRGQATAQVPQWARGFTIETADVEVIDLGTQFGVMASGGGSTDVVIFEGEVDLKPTGGSGRVLKRLIQGEAARVGSDGAINRIVEVRSDVKGGWSTLDAPGFRPGVFKAIRDNVPTSDGTKYYYYQITTAGLEDDAWAYVDRHPHQWNGLTPAGLPEFLRSADYARTFNDYRYFNDLEIVVELAAPADLYVFFDDRVPTPDWLLERFEDTGVNIGLDEGPWKGIPDHRVAVGPGNSIDNIFSVWRRRCERPETVTLGAVGETREARAMYGIAATPLDLKNTFENQVNTKLHGLMQLHSP
jgi:ferric-dicitrate binding protein FerR (iron transport regulator)